MRSSNNSSGSKVQVRVLPGVCGFECLVTAEAVTRHQAQPQIMESECGKVQSLAAELSEISLREVLAPVMGNPVYKAAHKAGLHPTCMVPLAVLKACEAVLGLAVPRDAGIEFIAQGK